jgi:hypothetical protein
MRALVGDPKEPLLSPPLSPLGEAIKSSLTVTCEVEAVAFPDCLPVEGLITARAAECEDQECKKGLSDAMQVARYRRSLPPLIRAAAAERCALVTRHVAPARGHHPRRRRLRSAADSAEDRRAARVLLELAEQLDQACALLPVAAEALRAIHARRAGWPTAEVRALWVRIADEIEPAEMTSALSSCAAELRVAASALTESNPTDESELPAAAVSAKRGAPKRIALEALRRAFLRNAPRNWSGVCRARAAAALLYAAGLVPRFDPAGERLTLARVCKLSSGAKNF